MDSQAILVGMKPYAIGFLVVAISVMFFTNVLPAFRPHNDEFERPVAVQIVRQQWNVLIQSPAHILIIVGTALVVFPEIPMKPAAKNPQDR